VSENRLSLTANGHVRYQLKTPYRDGTTHVIFEPLDFIARLAALVPKPRVNLTRLCGDLHRRVWLSPISTWELLVLVKKERVILHKDVFEWITEAMEKVPLQEAPLTHEVALATLNTGPPHPDPADNFLAATARVFKLTLVTADKRMLGVKGITTIGNR